MGGGSAASPRSPLAGSLCLSSAFDEGKAVTDHAWETIVAAVVVVVVMASLD